MLSKNSFKTIYRALVTTIAVILLIAPAVLASVVYTTQIQVAKSTAGDFVMAPLSVAMANSSLSSMGFYADANGRDTKLVGAGSTTLPRMMTTTNTYFATPVTGTSSQSITMTTANANTDFAIIPGYGGYITTPDTAALEWGGDFLFEYNGYLDMTGSTTGNSMVIKPGACIVDVNTANTVTGTIYTTAPAADQSYTGSYDADDIFHNSTYHYGQSFTTGGAIAKLYGISLYLSKVGTLPANYTLTFNIATTAAPNTVLASSTLTSTQISHAATNYFYFSSPPILAAGTQYCFYSTVNFTDGSNYLFTPSDNTAPAYAGGTRFYNEGAGWIADASIDWTGWAELIYGTSLDVSYTSVANLATGVHDIVIDANVGGSGNMRLTIDGTLRDTQALGGGSMTDTTNDWLFMYSPTSYRFPYATDIKINVNNTTPRLEYKPVTIISGTVLPDIVGTNHGAFTFGTNPAGITISYGAFTPPVTALTTTTEVTDPSMVGVLTPDSGMYISPASADAPGTQLDPVVTALAAVNGDAPNIFWRLLIFFSAMCLTFAVVVIFTEHLSFSLLAMAGVALVFNRMGVVDLWVFLLMLVIGIVMAILERRYEIL